MHEMPFTQSILDLALTAAGGKTIRRIHLRVGRLSAIVPASVEVFFDFLSKDTAAEGAELIFQMIPIVLTCRSCGLTRLIDHDESLSARQSLAASFRQACTCGKGDFTVTSGLSFDLAEIEIDETEPLAK